MASSEEESTTITFNWTVRGLRNLFESSRGELKSQVTRSARFGGGRWQVLLYPNSGHEGGYLSLYLSCEPTQEEKDNAVNGKWIRDGLFKFSFDLKTANKTSAILFNTKEACDHAFSYKTMNWGWAQFAKRDAVYYTAPQVKAADAFLIVCTITSSPSPPTPVSPIPRRFVPRALVDAIGSTLDDPLYSDVEFVLPAGAMSSRKTKRIYANKKILSRAEYFDTMFKSGFAETSLSRRSSVAGPPPIHSQSPVSQLEEDGQAFDNSDDSDVDSDSDGTQDTTIPNLNLSAPTNRDDSWETQSDVAVPSKATALDGSFVHLNQRSTSNAEGAVTGDESEAELPEGGRQIQPRDEVPVASAVLDPVQPQHSTSTSITTPGPPKTRVVIDDMAYPTYYAFLYYLYTDYITFAPLTSSYHTAGGSRQSGSAQLTPSVGPSTSQARSYFDNGVSNNRPVFRGLGFNLAAGGSTGKDDGSPRTRKEWIKQWMINNPSRPPPVSAKAIYRVADKLGLSDLKQRACQHIIRSLTVSNVPYEVFSSFSAAYDDIRKVEIEFFLEKWDEIRTGDGLKTVWQQIRHGRHPGFEEIWPLIAQHLVYRPLQDPVAKDPVGVDPPPVEIRDRQPPADGA